MRPTFKFKGKYNRTLTFSNDTLHIKQEKSWFKKEREVTVHIDEIKDVYFDKVGGVLDPGPYICFDTESFFISDKEDGKMVQYITSLSKNPTNLLCFYFNYIPGVFKDNEIQKEIGRLYSYLINYRDERLKKIVSKLEESTLDPEEKIKKLGFILQNHIIHEVLFREVKKKFETLF